MLTTIPEVSGKKSILEVSWSDVICSLEVEDAIKEVILALTQRTVSTVEYMKYVQSVQDLIIM